MKTISSVVAVLFVGLVIFPHVVLAQTKEDAIRLDKEAYALQKKAQSNTDLKQAEQKYLQAIAIFERLGNRENAGLAYNNVGLIYASWGQYDKAVDHYEKSLTIKREIKDRKGEGKPL